MTEIRNDDEKEDLEGLSHVLNMGIKCSYKSGDTITSCGEPCDSMYIILSGKVKTGSLSIELGEGETISELDFIRDEAPVSSSTSVALGDVELLKMNKESLLVLKEKYPQTAAILLMGMICCVGSKGDGKLAEEMGLT
jgi:CRP-like cAMP-binding protein